jgi:hypothetical protein
MKHVYPLNTTRGWCWLIAFLAVLICTTTINAQVSGVVFRDFDSNGIRSDTLPIELGVAGVTVRAFINFDRIPISTSSDAYGNYAFSSTDVPPGSSVRIEFDNFLTGYYTSSYGSNNGTSVQFLKAPVGSVDLGINYPSDYCQQAGKLLITSCFVNGNSQTTLDMNGAPVPLEKQSALTDAMVVFPYEASGIAGPGNFLPAHVGTAGDIGTVWGLAYQRRAKKVFSTAFVKRHTSFGPAGPGGIYVTDIASGTSSTFMSVTALGIDAGEDPHKDPLANLYGDRTVGSTDPSTMSAVGRMSFGGADMSEDDKTLYVVNLNDRKVYGLTLGLPAVVPTSASDVKSWSIPDPGCSNGDFRPWALKVYRGKVYVGVVCSAETSQQASDLNVTIYRFDPEATNAVFDKVLSFPLDYQRGPVDMTGTCITKDHWLPWTDAWPTPCGEGPTPRFTISSQPMVTDLEFDVDGSMFIGMLSRFAHLGGQANHDPSGNGNYDSFGFGDLLRAYNNNGTFELENNGQAGPLTGTGVGDTDGPGGGEFYGQDYWKFFGNVASREIASGALSFAPGYNEIINSAIDPIENRYLAAGLKIFDATKATVTRNYEIYRQAEGLFAKAGGLGDTKLLCDPAPIEIGNRFWFDDNRDGIQNAYEPGIDGVVLTLYDMDNGGIQIASQTTRDGGQFYFNNTTVPSGLQYNRRYEIRMNMTQLSALDITMKGSAPLSGPQRQYTLSPANSNNFTNPDLRDSDALLTGSTAIIAVKTLNAGQNDFTNDLGIYTCPELQNEKENLSRCSGMPLDSIVSTGTHLSQVDSVRFVVFSSPQSGTAMYGSGSTLLGTVLPDPTTGRAVLHNPALSTGNTTAGVVSQYIYALVWPMPADPNCRQSSQTMLTISPAVSVSAMGGEVNCSTTQITLNGQAIYGDGSLAANAAYTWAGPDGFSSNQQNPVVSVTGTYTLTVGNPACSSVQSPAAIASVTSSTAVPAVSVNSLTLTCIDPTGTLTASVSGGTTPYNYLWSTGATSQRIAVNTAGPYSVTVTGINGCRTVATATVTADLTAPAVSVNSLTLTCIDPTGTLTASVSGGTTPYNYLWSTGATSQRIAVNTAGPYSVTITSANGCIANATTSVLSDNAVPTAFVNSLTLTCANPIGMLTASSSGGATPYTYLWNTGGTTPSISVGSIGLYSVVVTGANGCSSSASVSVSQDSNNPEVSVNNLTLTCTNPSGTLTATASGRRAAYTYQWSSGATTPSISVSIAGPYSVTIAGANGCITTAASTVLSDLAQPSASVNSLTLTCANPSGLLTASATGSTAPYTYQWSTGQTTASITANAAGPFSVTVTGANGCQAVSSTTVIADTAVPTASVNSLTLTCADPTGTLTAEGSGGKAPYTYLWSTNATTPSISVGSAGSYSVVLTGTNGCSSSVVASVVLDTNQPGVSINALTLTCTNPSGTLSTSVTAGAAPYSYLWSTGQTTASIMVSAAGPYSVTVTGANGCSSTATTTVTSNTAVPVSLVNNLTLTCANPTGTLSTSVTSGSGPYTYLWSTGVTTPGITASSAGPYSVTITGANGCIAIVPATVTSDTAIPSASVNSLTLTCADPTGNLTATVVGGTAPYTYLWSTNASTPGISVGSAGSYSVVITGANGCSASTRAGVVSGTDQPSVSVNALTLNCTTLSGTLTASTTDGTAPYTYRWNTGATTSSIITSAAGPYSVTVTGANGCITTTNTTVVSETAVPIASVNTLALTCAIPSGTLSANMTGDSVPYTYLWNTGATTASITVGTAGPYSVTVTGSNGCNTLASTTVTSNTITPVMTTTVVAKSCVNCAATMLATSPGAILSWTGPNNFAIIGPEAQVTVDGTYVVTATASNGCRVSATLAVVPFVCPPTTCMPIVVRRSKK